MSTKQVKVTVVYGSVGTWKDGSFKVGESFVTTQTEADRIDPRFIKIESISEVAKVEATPLPQTEQKVAIAETPIQENITEKPVQSVAPAFSVKKKAVA
jgi:hypothetical protein